MTKIDSKRMDIIKRNAKYLRLIVETCDKELKDMKMKQYNVALFKKQAENYMADLSVLEQEEPPYNWIAYSPDLTK